MERIKWMSMTKPRHCQLIDQPFWVMLLMRVCSTGAGGAGSSTMGNGAVIMRVRAVSVVDAVGKLAVIQHQSKVSDT